MTELQDIMLLEKWAQAGLKPPLQKREKWDTSKVGWLRCSMSAPGLSMVQQQAC